MRRNPRHSGFHRREGYVTETRVLSADRPEDIARAARLLSEGALVALPTETVYGLAADARNAGAVERIFAAKGRPADNPLIVHIHDTERIDTLCQNIPDAARILAAAFWPGPLTLVLPAREVIPPVVRAGLPTVAVRMPAHPAALAVLRAAGIPLAAPSANRSGRVSPTTAAHVMADLAGRVEAVLDGGPCAWGVESTVVDLTSEPPRILRPGGVTAIELSQALGRPVLDAQNKVLSDARPLSPGQKYRHYAPETPLVLLPGSTERALDVLSAAPEGARVICFEEEREAFAAYAPLPYGRRDDPRALMRGLFAALRAADGTAPLLYARLPETHDPRYAAVVNRLTKAAGREDIRP